MRFNWRHVALLAVAVFLALVAFRLAFGPREAASPSGFLNDQPFQSVRKNYASDRISVSLPAGDTQKYEKIATLTELTANYDADRKTIDGLIASNHGIVQLERATGLRGQRALYLGIGVPPDRFDPFVEAVKAVGRNAQLDVLKNDKTNEYLQLRARRTTLEKARTGIEALATAAGGSIDERIRVQSKLTEIEERLQELGVSLGEFDSQNELCTVRLVLREALAAARRPWSWRIADALEWAAIRYALIGIGFLGLVVACWLAALLASFVRRLVAAAQAA